MNELEVTIVSPKNGRRIILEARGTQPMIEGIYNHYCEMWKKIGFIPEEKLYRRKWEATFRHPPDEPQQYIEYIHMVWTF